MEEGQIFDSSADSEIIQRQLTLVRMGMTTFPAQDEPTLTEEDFAAILRGEYSTFSFKKQYWIRRFYDAGLKLKIKQEDQVKKMMNQPATFAQMGAYIRDIVYGENGLKEGLDNWSAGINHYVVLMGEALRLKGLLTPEDIDAAEKSLQEKAKAEAAKVEAEGKEFLDTAKEEQTNAETTATDNG